ncbi:FAD dependent oxidoreductase family protein [Burkholderia gladioli]|uniref:FAD dependent oxidoreductase family protein n=1 Tax=Burkholderia gladioli TaxID=28095 RepID=A0A095HBK0_BURGA|nr:FAD-dependent oxidoreductase [Burkholderia gladioli]AJW98189.1 FAD dependent oxidoreductase family protein [Burkholderia gladioli]ASD79893.1 glycine cleavage system protein T [Burkholderia gladioli pv. gladioli]AWY54864.1 glycine cleavage system protein T [Burkholderia gladioli pv. gladioli]KGC10979.1 FAD dependent oxidoreductase family protein [Burkholderia gladioli]PEH37877.1 glycine cleavage system protein T [Burkholderia gladioli]
MKSHYQAVVIGGGVVGCSVLYHLTKFGWKDVALIERKVLTAGSTWHAAAGFHSINSDPNVVRLQAYTIALYKEIQEVGDQDVGLHVPGGVAFAATRERWEFLRTEWSRHRFMGIESELITPAEIKALCPLVETGEVLGGLWTPDEGHLDPYGATQAYARAAKKQGAEIHQHTKVERLEQRPDGTWNVYTGKGIIHAEHVVNAAGLWAREVGMMAGVKLPLIPMEHHYLITESIPELESFGKEIPVMVDLDGEIYMRQEHSGVLFGVYEKNSTPWSLAGTPWDYGETDLLQPNLEKLENELMKGFERFPSVGNAGIKRIVNGPFTFTPDGNPLVGPVRGKKNYWAACGCMAGFSQGGGMGFALAQWMINGEPSDNVFGFDVARFPKLTQNFVTAKAQEFYEHRFYLARPNEQWPAGRPMRTTPLYEYQQEKNAVFGVSYGLETPMWFARPDEDAFETPTFKRSNAFDVVAEECANVRQNVGLFDASGYAKYEVTGPGAYAWLDRMFASKIPAVGRARLAPMLGESGRLMGDLTILRPKEETFLITGSGYLQEWHMRWFESHLPSDGSVRIENRSDSLSMLAVAGPKAAQLVERLVGKTAIDAAKPLLSVTNAEAGTVPVMMARMSLTGEYGFELYCESAYVRTLYKQLFENGSELGLREYGVWALLSMRLEKGFGIWSREFAPEYTPFQNDLGHFVDLAKPDFIGRDGAIQAQGETPTHKLVMLEVEATDADASGFEPIWIGEQVVGFTTSGGYGHAVKKSLALGYIQTALINADTSYEVHVLGERRPAKLLQQVPYDPTGARMRAPK